MSLETRYRDTGRIPVSSSGTGGGSGSGTVAQGSANYLAYYPSAGTTVDDVGISVTTGNGIAPFNFTTLTSEVVSATTGDFWTQNSAGVFIKHYVAGTTFYVRMAHTDGSAAATSAGLAGTGGFYVTWAADGTLSADKVLTAGSNCTITTAGGTITISVTTGAIASTNYNFMPLLPQQAKLYPSNSAARIDAGTAWWRLLFSSTTQQFAVYQFIVPPDFGSNPYLRLAWAGGSSIGVVRSTSWVIDQWAISPNLPPTPLFYMDTFGGTNTVTIGLSAGYTSGIIQYVTIPLLTTVSLNAGYLTQIRISGTGNFVGDAMIGGLSFEYSRAS